MSIFQRHSFQKVIAAVVLAASLSVLPISAGALPSQTPTEPVTAAQSAVLMDVESHRVLYEKNADVQLAMASTTKIMTALVVLENCDLDEVVTVAKEAQGVEGSSIYLSAGEKLTVEQLLLGLMMHSGNDAAVALAIHCSGTVEGFVEKMNQKADEIGADRTKFVNPNGLPAEGHYTTARDLALIAATALKNEDFARIVSTKKAVIPWEGKEWDRVLVNKNKMLSLYDGANGVKTGYTKAAGRCLVSSAERDGMWLVAVVLNSSPMYDDCCKMLDYGFENYAMQGIINQGDQLGTLEITDGFETSVTAVAAEDFVYPMIDGEMLRIVVRLYSQRVRAPIYEGDIVGYADVYNEANELVDSIPLKASSTVLRNTFGQRLKNLFDDLFTNSAS